VRDLIADLAQALEQAAKVAPAEAAVSRV